MAKTPFSVVNAYKANDKKTDEPIIIVQGFRQANSPVKFPTQFVFTQEEFEELFDGHYDYEQYCLGLGATIFYANYKVTYTDVSLSLEE